jgi:cytochrome oxidase complex assembly protein 1
MQPEVQPVPKRTSPWAWIGIGCGVLFVGFIGFVVFILVVVFGAMRKSEPYREAMARAQSDPRVAAALGSPVKDSFFFSGSINTHNNDGDAKLDIPISGPKGAGLLHVTATKTDGKWFYNRMYVQPKNGSEIDLMTSP